MIDNNIIECKCGNSVYLKKTIIHHFERVKLLAGKMSNHVFPIFSYLKKERKK